MKHYNLPDGYNWNSPMTILTILRKQPPKGWFTDGIKYKGQISFEEFEGSDNFIHISLPHAVGEKVGCWETWALEEYALYKPIIHSYFYTADLSEEELELFRIFSGNKWYSSATMPTEAIRRWLKITSVDCKRVQKIYPTDMMEIMGLEGVFILDEVTDKDITVKTFINWFNSLHAEPKAVRKGGKIIGYKSYVYDWKSGLEHLVKLKGIKIGDMPIANVTYKGLPLEIIPDPYVVVEEGKEIEKP